MLGWGVIHSRGNRNSLIECGCIRNKSNTTLPERLQKIEKELRSIIKKHEVQELGVEEIFFSKNVKTAISVAQAKGIVLLLGAKAKLSIKEYKPNQVKQAICGYGKADKKQVQEMVKRLLKLPQIIKQMMPPML